MGEEEGEGNDLRPPWIIAFLNGVSSIISSFLPQKWNHESEGRKGIPSTILLFLPCRNT